ncbi:hypothetical protein FB451DRAFT_1387378 [Mycena latifolia]|nr:hypothetical protein FB451DRAFT_1387378 [Mycena latifolia]
MQNKKSKSKGKKSKVLNENNILPANAEINRQIAHLRTKWACSANDSSEHCWISSEEKDHIPLAHTHFNMWAAAILNGAADDETPPNHGIFKSNGKSFGLAQPSLLQHRVTNQASAQASPVINNHFSLPDSLINLLRLNAATPPASAVQTPENCAPEVHLMLLSPNTSVGECISIETFCRLYDLDNSIAQS